MNIVFYTIATLFSVILVGIIAQEWRYYSVRRNTIKDQQNLFHGSNVFHVITALKLAPEQELINAVKNYIETVKNRGAKVIYAGKVIINATRSSQIPADDWDAFVLIQYPDHKAWEETNSREDYQSMRSEFGNTYSLGMQRPAVTNLLIPILLLGRRFIQIIKREPSPYPFKRTVAPEAKQLEIQTQTQFMDELIRVNGKYSEDAIVIVNFQKHGNEAERKADKGYANAMMALMAELGYGPTHIGKAVTLQGDAYFDQVVLVYYPGVEFFFDMVRSEFFNGIIGGKQLGDNQASPTVPLLGQL